jgi:hypothetical protein
MNRFRMSLGRTFHAVTTLGGRFRSDGGERPPVEPDSGPYSRLWWETTAFGIPANAVPVFLDHRASPAGWPSCLIRGLLSKVVTN